MLNYIIGYVVIGFLVGRWAKGFAHPAKCLAKPYWVAGSTEPGTWIGAYVEGELRQIWVLQRVNSNRVIGYTDQDVLAWKIGYWAAGVTWPLFALHMLFGRKK